MALLELNGTREGNTKSSRVTPGMYWCFTLNNYSMEEMARLEQLFVDGNIEYLFGEEIGEEKGTPHLQGYIRSKTRIRPDEKFKNKRIHWEKCRGSEEQNTRYCRKGGKIHTNMRIIRDVIAENGAYDWQRDIIETCDREPDGRKINWYWEKKGNVGKTELAKHLYLKHGNDMIYVNGKAADVKCAIAGCERKPKIIIFGIPRQNEEYVSYAVLEEVKDGIFFSGKYESGMVVFPTPHIFVFANFAPDTSKLSADRWNIVNLSKDPDSDEEDEIESPTLG